MSPRVSIVIPTKNGGVIFKKVLEAIFERQTLRPFEVIIIDQKSTDGTLEVACRYPVRVLQIEPHEFRFGKTRNQGIRSAQGDYIVFLNQDTPPATEEWLFHLVHPFEKDENLAGVYGKQIPCSSNPCESFSMRYTYPDTPTHYTEEDISRFSAFHILFSNVNACIRKDVWRRFHLNEKLIVDDDTEWAMRVLGEGYRILYEPRASVFHTNHYTLSKIFRRTFEFGVSHRIFVKIPRRTYWLLGCRFLFREIRDFVRCRKFHMLPYLLLWESARALGFLFGHFHRTFPAALRLKMAFYRRDPKKNIPISQETCEVSCLLCGFDRSSLLCLARDELLNRGGFVHRIVQCSHCGLVYLNPRPQDEVIKKFYPEEYPSYTIRGLRAFSRIGLNINKYLKILPYQQNGKLLDVGCATGSFLDFMKRRKGWDVYGIEMDPKSAHHVKSLGIPAFCGAPEEAPFEENFFDVMTFWDVLEHLPYPRKALRKAKQMLEENGVLVMCLPNIHSFGFRLFGHRYLALDAPRHFFHFSRETLTRLLSEEGFSIRHLSSNMGSHYDIYFFFHSLVYTLRRGERCLQDNPKPFLYRLRNAFAMFIAAGITLLASPLFFVPRLRREGPELFVVARKTYP